MGDESNFAGRNPFSDSPVNTPPVGIRSIFQANHGFGEEDFCRESLGIFDFSRESLSFLHENVERESLGIINLDNLDTGRESLGIVNIRTYDFVLSKCSLPATAEQEETDTVFQFPNVQGSRSEFETPKFKINDFELSEQNITENCSTQSSFSLLNDAFLQQSSFPSLNVSSVRPSFNSSSLNSTLPSRISSRSRSALLDPMNDAFRDTTDFIRQMQLYVRSTKSTNSPVHKKADISNRTNRISSLPSTLETKRFSFDERNESSNDFDEVFVDDSCKTDGFTTSVFIEAAHIAEKIADGSILTQDFMLDTTQEPAEFANILDDEESVKCDTEEVYKNIDKLFISPRDDNKNVSKNENETPEVVNTTRRSSSVSSNSKSKNAIEMIDALSDILNDDNRDEQKINEGHSILANLAEFFHSGATTKSRLYALDDSGHSSIESVVAMAPVREEAYEVLDLSKKCHSESNLSHIGEEVCMPLDLSVKSKSSDKAFTSPKILPHKFNRSKQKSLSKVNQSMVNNYSTSSNEGRNSSDLTNKFRPKKCEAKVSSFRRGPMKAVLPVDTMAKTQNNTLKLTPKHSEPFTSKLKKTSTPINQTNVKPLAQSTPDGLKNAIVTSPVARPNLSTYSGSKISKPKLNYSGARMSLKKSKSVEAPISPVKRRSSSDGKLTSLNKNIKRNSFSYFKNEAFCNVLKENGAKAVQRSFIKRVGKENK